MIKRIHVNQHNIKKNKKNKINLPVITVKTYKSNSYGHEVEILDENGKIAAKVMYSPTKPLSCGARVWIETHNEVIVKNLELAENKG